MNLLNVKGEKMLKEKDYVQLLIEKMDTLQRVFNETYGIDLFKGFKLSSLHRLSKQVSDQDLLTSQLINLVSTSIESINVKEVDMISGISTGKSIKSLIIFLKKHFPEESLRIDEEINIKLWAVYNVRTEYSHIKNRSFQKALRTLNLKLNEYTPGELWDKAVLAISDAFNEIIVLLLRKISPSDDEALILQALEEYRTRAKIEVTYLIENYPHTEVYLHYLINRSVVTDEELAHLFQKDTNEMRKTLYPLLSQILIYRYIGQGVTEIRMIDEMIPLVREVLSTK
ncbi:hypothetical protein MC28_G400 (plasmid) [Bacillus thuringiensis MC28]|nr:hypothetical protein MC28_G400 [Bacillus thuringiensis MC28]